MILLSKVTNKLREIREANQKEQERRLKEIREKIPEWTSLERKERDIGFDLARYVIESKDISQLREESEFIQERKASLLRQEGYPPDYLESIYNCEICKDTGNDGTQMCSCKKRMLVNEAYSMSGIEDIIVYQNFDNFDLDIFRDQKEPSESLSPRQIMEYYLAEAKSYVKNFPNISETNLYFYGPVGTGKTYMSNCIAKELMDNGFTVVYQTSNKLLNFIADYNFSKQDYKEKYKDKFDLLNSCDLLIIDDLGTEISTSVSNSNLFELINERLISDKASIISSNLDINGIREYYDDRIFSRIVGNYKMINFFGDDLRTSKYR